MKKKKIAILISGRGSNMEAIIKNAKHGILKDLCSVEVVVSNKRDARGILIAKKLGVRTECVPSKGLSRDEYSLKLAEVLKKYDLDYIVLAGFMRILSPYFVNLYKNRIINIHPADTALYKGKHGYEWAFKNGLKKTYITVHFVDEGIDTGAVIAKKEVNLEGAKTLEEVEQRGLLVEHEFYSAVLKEIFEKN